MPNIQKIEQSLTELISSTIKSEIQKINGLSSDWMSLSEAAKYAGVSYNTFIKFRTMGLKVCEIEGIKRVSRKEIDCFFEKHSY